tara:strand:+ start:10 stop:1383 length:1374 start_codon:yes stop_codon:yes gene_type:complete
MVAILGANSVSGGYEVSNSLRFNSSDSARLTDDFSSASRQTFTFSTWFKRSKLSATMSLLSSGTSNSERTSLFINSDDTVRFFSSESDSVAKLLKSNAVLRDPSAWYHLVLRYDSTQSTDTDRIRFYLNGSEMDYQSSPVYPAQNNSTQYIGSNDTHAVGCLFHGSSASEFFDGYMTETHYIDGTSLDHTSFGEFNDNKVWIPIKYTGTYGTNGFFLQFKQTGTSQNSSGIGADTSGNDNHFAVTNLAATDITEDTCTNNFCTLSSIANQLGTALSEGNLQQSDTSNDKNCFSTFGLTQGKWYFEVKVPTQGSRGNILITDADHNEGLGTNFARVELYNGNVSTSATDNGDLSSFSNNDILCVALNLDDGEVYFSKGADIDTSGTATVTNFPLTGTNRDYRISHFGTSTGTTVQFNFGNPPFTISSGNSDGEGFGNFEFSPPSGYFSLCTKNLAEYG